MFSGPMFRREYRESTRRRRPFVERTIVAALLATATLLVACIVIQGDAGEEGGFEQLRSFGRIAFVVIFVFEQLFLTFFVPSFVAGSIAQEREKDTLSMLLLTRLRPIEIVLTKAVARWLPALNTVLIGLPILLATAWMAGFDLVLVLALLVMLSTSIFMAALSIAVSATGVQAPAARAKGFAWIFGWLIMPPLLTLMPVRTASLWGELLAEVKALCALVAPSSPLSLATDLGWYYRPQVESLSGRVALMVGLQTAFALLGLAYAATHLKAREKHPNWIDPTRGYRPPCGDDPIFWREFEMPMRRGGGSLIGYRLRYVTILVRAILINAMALVATVLVLSIPFGLLFATLYYGVPAFQERWQHGYGSTEPFVEGWRFNLVVRAAAGLLGLMPAAGLAALAAGRITTERDKKTWETLLTTPLDGWEILAAKARAALHGLWLSAWPLPVIAALGLACGVVWPLGVVWAAADLLLALWASMATSFSVSLRPGPTSAASSRVALLTLVFILIHGYVIAVLLASPPEIAAFAGWDAKLRWGVMLSLAVVPILTGAIAWIFTRRMLDRFDEWVGRPIRADGPHR